MDEKPSITLPDDLAQSIRAQVESGAFSTSEDVVREALTAWFDRRSRLGRLKALIAESIDDPRPSVPAEEVDAYFDARVKALATAKR